jgi:hypothetical protein
MSWEDILKVRRRPKKKLPPSNPFAGESKRYEETEAAKLEAKKTEEAERQAELDENRKLVRRGRIKFERLEETEEGHKTSEETSRQRRGVLSETRCTLCGVALGKRRGKKLSRGKGDPNKNLRYCTRCAGLLAGTLTPKEFKQLNIDAFGGKGRQKTSGGARRHWRKDGS